MMFVLFSLMSLLGSADTQNERNLAISDESAQFQHRRKLNAVVGSASGGVPIFTILLIWWIVACCHPKWTCCCKEKKKYNLKCCGACADTEKRRLSRSVGKPVGQLLRLK